MKACPAYNPEDLDALGNLWFKPEVPVFCGLCPAHWYNRAPLSRQSNRIAMSRNASHQPWGGRFSEGPDARVAAFTESVSFDHRLAAHDIRGSIAHARMLAQVGVLTEDEFDQLHAGLTAISEHIQAGTFAWDPALEDVHMNIEARL